MLDTKKENRFILGILIPIILENVLLTLSSLVITGYVGRLLILEISAQGVANRLYGIYFSVFKGLSIGLMVLAARHFGSGHMDRCRTVQARAMAMILPLSLLTSLLMFIFRYDFFRLITQDAQILDLASRYFQITVLGFPFVAITALNTAAFQAQGNTRRPLYIAAFGNLFNIFIGYVLIFGTAWTPAFSLRGAAFSLVSSQILSASLGLWGLYSHKIGLFKDTVKVSIQSMFDRFENGRILATGVPAAFENTFWQFATLIISRVIIAYGTAHYAASQMGLQAEGLSEMLSVGFVTASISLASIAIGKQDDALFKFYFKRLTQLSLLISTITMTLLFFFAENLMGLLTDKVELIQIGTLYLKIMAGSQIPQNMSKVLNGFIRSSGYKTVPMLVSFTGLWLVRVPLSLLAQSVLGWDIVTIWWIINLDQWVRFSISLMVFLKAKLYDAIQAQALA